MGHSVELHACIGYQGRSDGGYIGIYTLPKSVPENYFCALIAADVVVYRTVVSCCKKLYPPKMNFWLRPCWLQVRLVRSNLLASPCKTTVYNATLTTCCFALFHSIHHCSRLIICSRSPNEPRPKPWPLQYRQINRYTHTQTDKRVSK